MQGAQKAPIIVLKIPLKIFFTKYCRFSPAWCDTRGLGIFDSNRKMSKFFCRFLNFLVFLFQKDAKAGADLGFSRGGGGADFQKKKNRKF